jgi:hypothetical protein
MQFYDESESSSDSDNSEQNVQFRYYNGPVIREASGLLGRESSDDSSAGMPELLSHYPNNSSSSSSSSNSVADGDDQWMPELSNPGSDSDSDSSMPDLAKRRGAGSSSSSSSDDNHRVSANGPTLNHSDSDSSIPDLTIRRGNPSSSSDHEEPGYVRQFQRQTPFHDDLRKDSQIDAKGKQRKKRPKKKLAKQKKVQASTKIQAVWRGSLVRIRWRCANRGFTVLQAWVRGRCTRQKHSDTILHLEHYRIFLKKWWKCINLLDRVSDSGLSSSWATIREKQTYIKRQELVEMDEMKETDEKMDRALEEALHIELETESANVEVKEIDLLEERRKNSNNSCNDGNSSRSPEIVKRIQLSNDVVKWLKTGDNKYKDFFIRRMKQLSCGERSRILAKRLVGSKQTIYETYLEQKSGFRILWTERHYSIFVWYVAKHKNVSRLMGLIDSATNRSESQRISGFDMEEVKDEEGHHRHKVFLDPLGNVPLKIYDIDINAIDEISLANWTPTLYLTAEERDVVEMQGTVLLLGRSGTGKTVCICNRMELDRKRYENDPHFSQLFISRSKRLCRYVELNIGKGKDCYFETFDDVICKLECELPHVEGIRDTFHEFDEVDFDRFKSEVYSEDDKLDSLLIWTNIRSFIKGSVEAIQQPNYVLSREEYISTNYFGKKRCRLTTEQRHIVYDVYTKYERYLKEKGLWDKGDKIISIINRLQHTKLYQPDLLVKQGSFTHWSKIYVDEVQDYTQTEILLFFQMSGPGDLFLAGDPAQNVQKGVEFRFDDIRSVGYYFSGENRSHLIPPKPKIVNINFRSHAGILDAASAILGIMFTVFPDSAKQLGRDEGLFRGPRPGVFQQAKKEIIRELVAEKMNGAVILTHDDNVKMCKQVLGGYHLIYGIREAKGLEFKGVIVFDFFSSLPAYLQKPWRDMLHGRTDDNFHNKYPELEAQLKLLYTAVTRCIDRLFFCETVKSIAGDAFIRYITTLSIGGSKVSSVQWHDGNQAIATLNDIDSIENMLMSSDEWLVSGVANAEAAEVEGSAYSGDAHGLMTKAIYCFEQSKNDSFLKKAKVHLESLQFRRVLLDHENTKSRDESSVELEMQAVAIMEKLLRENLLYEARALGMDLRSIVREVDSSTYFLDHSIIEKLTAKLRD